MVIRELFSFLFKFTFGDVPDGAGGVNRASTDNLKAS